jgi:energy-coupling factor transporter transmembrane protein EcfT
MIWWLVIAIECVVAIAIICFLIANFFRRPIEHYGFIVCVVGLLFGNCIVSPASPSKDWLLGLYCIFLLWPFGVLLVGFLGAYLIRRLRLPLGLIAALVFAGLFGIITGYCDAWDDELSSHDYGASCSILAAYGGPGDYITSHGCDTQIGEMWYYRNQIAVWNGVVWLIAGFTVAATIYLVTLRCRVCRAACSQSVHAPV